MRRSSNGLERGFTIVELLVVLGIMGLLIALLMPAVQAARESARGTQCSSNLKNIGIALANFQSVRRTFPVGSELLAGTEQAWSSRILPFLEESSVAGQIDYRQPWNAPGQNLTAADQDLAVYMCPSAVVLFPGKADYGGIMGTALLPLKPGSGPTDAFGCGVLIVTNVKQTVPVSPAKITDGLSTTLCVGESADREDATSSRWACGRNCFSQNDPWVNVDELGSLHSHHPAGAHGLFADAHVQMLHDAIDPSVLGAICTRNGGEADVASPLAQ